jgi:hypothetical protein
MSAASVRQRNPKSDLTSKTTPTTSADEVPDEVEDASPVISVLDIIRIIFTLCVASCALSYYLTSGESVLWGYRPWLTRPQLLKAYFVSYTWSYRALTSGVAVFDITLLTRQCTEWTREPHTLPIIHLRRFQPRPSGIPFYQRHHFRRLRWPPYLRSWW